MNPPDPYALTRTHDDDLTAARAATNGLTAEQKADVALVLMLRHGLFGAGEVAAEAMRVAAIPK